MKKDCLDIGTIQAFLDGELSHEKIDVVSTHVALCNDCASMLAEAEDQSATVFSTLERELDTLVPTQRLWIRINDSIALEHENRPFWQKAYAYLTVALRNPSFAMAVGLLVVIGVFTSLMVIEPRTPADEAVRQSLPAEQPVPLASQTKVADLPAVSTLYAEDRRGDVVVDTEKAGYTIQRAAYRPEPRRVTNSDSASVNPTTAGYLPGEESYVKTIASLAKTVEEQKDSGLMSPSERVAYERDMALVNDAISRMKKEVRRNPRNESAKQVLYASYQNKIDLLSSVSQKEDLLVSLR